MRYDAWAAAALAVGISCAVFVFDGGRVRSLGPPDASARRLWQNLTASTAALKPEDISRFNETGRLLLQAAVPPALVEQLLLPELAELATPPWAQRLLWHLRDRFKAVTYGVSLQSRQARDFWTFGPAARLVAPLLNATAEIQGQVLLLADAYYSVGTGSSGLHFHTDAPSSYCLTSRATTGVSFWLALDETSESAGGGLEVCDVSLVDAAAPQEQGNVSCEAYTVRRGDVILFSKHAKHRTQQWLGGQGLRRSLVGRLVPMNARLATLRTPPSLIYTNGFNGQYLCKHGLAAMERLGDAPHCFPPLGSGEPIYTADVELRGPVLQALLHRFREATAPLQGSHLTQPTALALTLLSELAVAACWWQIFAGVFPERARFCAACATASLLTHPFVWLWATVIFRYSKPVVRIWTVELLVVFAESTAVWGLLRWDWRLSWKSGQVQLAVMLLVFAFVMNSCSVALGFLLSDLFQLYGGGFSPFASLVSWSLGLYLGNSLCQ